MCNSCKLVKYFISSGKVVNSFRPSSKYNKFVSCPISFGNDLSWLKFIINICKFVSLPISEPTNVSWFELNEISSSVVKLANSTGNFVKLFPSKLIETIFSNFFMSLGSLFKFWLATSILNTFSLYPD